MNNCAEFQELISAYADGELTEDQRRRVVEHLSVCDRCSALIALYREISIAMTESCVPAPEELRSRVMENIVNGGAAGEKGGNKRQRIGRIVLTRYLPMAACLALLLLTLPWIINNFIRTDDYADYAPAPMAMTESYDVPFGLQDGMSAAGGIAPAPDVAAPAEAHFESDEEANNITRASRAEDADDVDDDELVYQSDPRATVLEPSGIIETFDEIVSASFVWITITGEMPDNLMEYEPESLGDWTIWDKSFIIPRAAAQELIIEIGDREGVSIEYGDDSSEYALVLYSDGETGDGSLS